MHPHSFLGSSGASPTSAPAAPSVRPKRASRGELTQRKWYRAWQRRLEEVQARGRAQSLGEGIALFLEDLRRRGRRVHTTCRDADYALRGFVRWSATRGCERIDALDRQHVVDYLRHVAGQHFSVYYVKQIRVTLKQFLGFLHDAGLLDENLAADLRPPKLGRRPRHQRVLTPHELARLLAAPQRWAAAYAGRWRHHHRWLATRDQAVIALLAATGIRACEASDLLFDDVDTERGLAVVHSKGHHLYIRPQRLVFVDTPRLSTALDAWLAQRPPDARHLFTCSVGRQLAPQTFWQVVTKYARVAELGPGVTPHALRHTFCTTIIKRGVDPYTAQMLMGHRSVVHTLRWYTHLSADDLRADWKAHHPLGSEAPR